MNYDKSQILAFKRSSFYNDENKITYIGEGETGGKASGLLHVSGLLNSIDKNLIPDEFNVSIPRFCVIRTEVFKVFMERNNLYKIALSKLPDERKAHAFQQADLPFEILGDLRSLISQVQTPLAIRSSSLLEDAKDEPFAGIYETKMIPNNQADADSRFKKLVEAIKFIYASTFFKIATDYMQATPYSSEEEKMAVIIQEVAGKKRENLFYPQVSGVIRSFNYYSFGNSNAEDGVVNLALGLGKTIVENEASWYFSPAFPKTDPPFYSLSEMMKNTQTKFWAVDMSGNYTYNPLKETEFLSFEEMETAEKHGLLKQLASTLDSQSGRIVMGIGKKGARILNFAPLLKLGEIRIADLCSTLAKICSDDMGTAVEIEFTLEIDEISGKHEFGFLQMRPMNLYNEKIDIDESELFGDNLICSSPSVLGNGIINNLTDIVLMKARKHDVKSAYQCAKEIDEINQEFLKQQKKYLLFGYGRWGTSDPWAGIPVTFGQISQSAAIVEAPFEGMNSELSQGSHFFHNLSAFKIIYFSIPYSGSYNTDLQWLENQKIVSETENILRIKLSEPLLIKADGFSGRGIIKKPEND